MVDTKDRSDSGNKGSDDANTEPIEYNPRHGGYTAIIFSSIVNFGSVAGVPGELRAYEWYMAIAFGAVTFALAALILIQDRSQKMLKYFHYTKAKDGMVEGVALVCMTVWWLGGVAYITTPGGIAYVASNIYYSAWLSLFSCAYTLNLWSTDKDILSVAEITSVSYTLKGWWIHFISAVVVFASSIHLSILLNDFDGQDASFGVALGLVSMCVSFFYILVHYDFFSACRCEEGGWTELGLSLFLFLIWVIGLSVLTQEGAIAATLNGSECTSSPFYLPNQNCTLVIHVEDSSGAITQLEIPCGEVPRQIPGSNLYYACWSCMLSIVYVVMRWKAAQAIKFAQAREERQQKQLNGIEGDGSDIADDDDDDDERSDSGGEDI